MLASREITVNYMTPLGLHHIMGYNHHYGPAPWFDKARDPTGILYIIIKQIPQGSASTEPQPAAMRWPSIHQKFKKNIQILKHVRMNTCCGFIM